MIGGEINILLIFSYYIIAYILLQSIQVELIFSISMLALILSDFIELLMEVLSHISYYCFNDDITSRIFLVFYVCQS